MSRINFENATSHVLYVTSTPDDYLGRIVITSTLPIT